MFFEKNYAEIRGYFHNLLISQKFYWKFESLKFFNISNIKQIAYKLKAQEFFSKPLKNVCKTCLQRRYQYSAVGKLITQSFTSQEVVYHSHKKYWKKFLNHRAENFPSSMIAWQEIFANKFVRNFNTLRELSRDYGKSRVTKWTPGIKFRYMISRGKLY